MSIGIVGPLAIGAARIPAPPATIAVTVTDINGDTHVLPHALHTEERDGMSIGIVASSYVTSGGTGSAYADAVLALNPVCYLRLGEAGTTTLADASGNGHNGTAESTDGLGTTGLLTGDADTCRTFASGRYVTVPEHADFNITGNFSIVCWVKTATDIGDIQIASRWDNSGSQVWLLDGANGGRIRFFAKIAAANIISESTLTDKLNQNVNYMVGVTYDGTNVILYRDGSAIVTTPATGSIDSATLDYGFVLGGREDGSGVNATTDYLDGPLDEFAIFDTALSSTDMANLYTAATT